MDEIIIVLDQITINQSVYKTPRAFLIEYLNDDRDNKLAKWIVKDKDLVFNPFELSPIWASYARPTLHGNYNYDHVSWSFFHRYIYASTNKISSVLNYGSYELSLKLIKTSKEKRNIVNDLTVGNLYEWMLRFLLEESREDWIAWNDKDKKEFRLYDMEGMWKMYTYVHDNTTTCSMYYFKLLLSSYCSTGILKEIDSNTNCYQFDKAWYDQELMRTKEVTLPEENYHDNMPSIRESQQKFPNHTKPLVINFNYLS